MARLCHELKVCLFGSCKATDILDNAGLHIIKTKNRDFISFFFFFFGSMVLTGKPSGLKVSLFVFLLWISAHIAVLEH